MPRGALALAFTLALLLLAPAAQGRNAYVANNGAALGDTVSVFDTTTGASLSAPVTVGTGPFAEAIAPDGSRVFVANQATDDVSVIGTATNTTIGPAIGVGDEPHGIALSPDGTRAYVGSEANPGTVSVIDTATAARIGSPITVGRFPIGLAVTPDGARVYVTSSTASGGVSVIDTRTGETVGQEIPVGSFPYGIAITPDGKRAYVANNGSESVSVIEIATNAVVGAPIPVGISPGSLAISPNGARAYVANFESGSVTVIDTATNTVIGAPIAVGGAPFGIAIDPSGARAYVDTGKSVAVIDTSTDTVVGSPIPVGLGGRAVAIVPDQPPHASFAVPDGRPGVPVPFDASGSTDFDGSIARYDWSFGDGRTLSNGGPDPRHTYKKPGDYKVTLTLTDDEGCSTTFVFTGQTAYCNGSPSATQTQAIQIAYPGVLLRCPKRAGHRGCRYRLQAVTRRHGGKVESAVAKAKAKAGGRVVVALKAKPAFSARLARARSALVKEQLTVRGSTKTRIARLKIVR